MGHEVYKDEVEKPLYVAAHATQMLPTLEQVCASYRNFVQCAPDSKMVCCFRGGFHLYPPKESKVQKNPMHHQFDQLLLYYGAHKQKQQYFGTRPL